MTATEIETSDVGGGNPVCPTCGSTETQLAYSVDGVPTNSVLLLDSPDAALSVATGDVRIRHCLNCGHTYNAAFQTELTEYSGQYESTQGFSSTFNRFHARLAQDMIDRFDVRGRDVIEIGCGDGEFLVLLCELGENRGLGFDPAFHEGNVPIQPDTEIEFVADFYSEKYSDRSADFIVCKMTLEHIIDTGSFVAALRDAIGDRTDVQVCFQIPNARYVFGDIAFWDVYYEHCSYFSHGSLAWLFRNNRFEVTDLWTDYDDQYLIVAATPTDAPTEPSLPAEADLAEVTAEVRFFADEAPRRVAEWRRRLQESHAAGRTTVLWGGGSKAVAFLTTLGVGDEIAAAVDINPRKHGTYLGGTGHKVIGPDDLVDLQPDEVIVMNPIYTDEIAADLRSRALEPVITPLD